MNGQAIEVRSVAKICHEANKALCEALGDCSQQPWELSPEWQQSSAVNGVRFRLNNSTAPASASHDSWMQQKIDDGWKYGEVKDPSKKEHPCMVPFEQLPLAQQRKDHLFTAIVDALRPLIWAAS